MGSHQKGRLDGRRVAITGGGGFVGSHLIGRLLEAGASVELLGPVQMKRPEVVEAIRNGTVSYEPEALDGRMTGLNRGLRGVDALIHLNLRYPTLQGFWAAFNEQLQSNVSETTHLLEAAETGGVKVGVLASSVSVYEPPARYDPSADRTAESSPVGGFVSPYGEVKLVQEWCFREWGRRNGHSAAILRLASVYGPGETVGRAVPNFIRAALDGRQPIIDGAGDRPFDLIFVRDVAEAFTSAVEHCAEGTFNVGTGVARTPLEVASLALHLCGVENPTVRYGQGAARGGVICDVSKIAEKLGFSARTPLEVGLQEEIDWFRKAG